MGGFALIVEGGTSTGSAFSNSLVERGLVIVRANSVADARTRIAFQEFALFVVELEVQGKNTLSFLNDLALTASTRKTPLRVVVVRTSAIDPELQQKIQSLPGVMAVVNALGGAEVVAAAVAKCFPPPKQPVRYDVRIINAFLGATIRAISGNTGSDPKNEAPFVRRERVALGDFTGVITFHNEALSGAVALSFERACVEDILRFMFQDPNQQFEERLMVDFAGEMCNQLAGGAQNSFEKDGVRFELSTADLLVGHGVEIFKSFDAPCLVIPFSWKGHHIYTQFVLTGALDLRSA